MAKRNKNNREGTTRRKASIPEKRSASPTPPFELHITVFITPRDSNEIAKAKDVDINLPITSSELAYKIANIAFALADELAFKAKLLLTPEKSL
jgi:hypothetical protein